MTDFHKHLSGAPLDITTLELPAETVEEAFKGDGASFENIELVRSDVSREVIEDALSHVNPDIPYQTWITIAAALRHHYGETPEEGLEIFDEWSSKGDKYESSFAVRKQYNRFEANPDQKPATIGTLLYHAEQAGWVNTVKSAKALTLEVQLEQSGNAGELEDLMGLISQSEVSKVQREALVSQIAHKSKELNCRLPVPLIRESCQPVHEVEDEELPEWLHPWVYIEETKEFFNSGTTEIISFEAFNSRFTADLLSSEEKMDFKGIGQRVASNYALFNQEIKRCKGVQYRPGKGPLMRCGATGSLYANSYQSCFPEPDAQLSEKAGEILTEHLEWLTNSPEEAEVIIDFFAYTVQNPGKKILWALFIQSDAEGAGKSVLIKLMSSLIGNKNINTPNVNAVNSEFNGWAEGSMLTFCDEVISPGRTKTKVMNNMKSVITDESIHIIRKGKDGRDIPNVTNYIFFSNHLDALALNDASRRFYVVASSVNKDMVQTRLKDGGFDKIWALVKKPSYLYHYLLYKKFSAAFNPLKCVETDSRAEVIEANHSSLTSDIQVMIDDEKTFGVYKHTLSIEAIREALPQSTATSVVKRAVAPLGYIAVTNHATRPRINKRLHNVWAKSEKVKAFGIEKLVASFKKKCQVTLEDESPERMFKD